MRPYELTRSQRKALLEDVMSMFLLFCEQEFQTVLYAYQIKVARELFNSLFVEPVDVYVKIARQAGKTETLTLVFKFLIIYYRSFFKVPLMAAIASPKGEQAKTDIDRIKKSIQLLRQRWDLEDRENNAATIRAYRHDLLTCEMFRFSLAPTTDNESKTLNVLAIEESHKADHAKRRDQLDPMLASTGGPTWHFGVGCPVVSDFLKGCKGQLPGVAIVIDAEEVSRDRRAVSERTGDPTHLAYERKFRSDVAKFGRQNPEIRRNYFMEDTVEEGNFISRERLIEHARPSGVIVPTDTLYLGADWARRSDHTWDAITNEQDDLIDWLKVPHVPYREQVEIKKEWLYRDREHREGSEVTRWRYIDRIMAVRADSTGGTGDAPNEILAAETALPMGDDALFTFTKQSKNALYLHFETLLFKEGKGFTYPADHPLASEFEEQMVNLERTYTGDGEYLSVHHPNTPEGRDDAPDATALALFARKSGELGEILVA